MKRGCIGAAVLIKCAVAAAVILNEHLVEALRRLKTTSSDTNVDRRLVTNVLISFFNTPRADTKRFEILQLLASVLQWDDEERERAGLQKSSAPAASGKRGHNRNRATSGMSNVSSFTDGNNASTSSISEAGPSYSASSHASGPSSSPGHARTPGGGESIDFAANESFSNLWIEYLLRESGTAAAHAAATSEANPHNISNNTPTSANTLRSPPLSGLANLSLSPPSRTGPSSHRQPSPSSIVSSAAGSSTAGSSTGGAQDGLKRDTPASSVVSEKR